MVSPVQWELVYSCASAIEVIILPTIPGLALTLHPGLTQTFRPRQETFSRTPMMTKFEVTPFDSWTANVEDSVISTPQIMKQISFMIANGASFNDQGTFTLQQVGNSALAAVTTATNTSGTTAMANYTDISRHNGAIKLAYTAAGTPPAYSIDEIGPYVTVMVSVRHIPPPLRSCPAEPGHQWQEHIMSGLHAYTPLTRSPPLRIPLSLPQTSEFMQYPLMTGLMDITVPVGGTSDVYRVALTSTWHKLMPQYGNAATNLSTFAAMNPVTKAAVGMAGNKVNDVDGMVNNAVTGLLTTFLASPQTNNLNQLQRLAPVPANAANAFAFVAFGAGCSATAGQAITGSAQLKVMNVPGECQSYRDCDKSGSDHPSLSYRLSANDDEERLRHCVVAPSPENPLMPYTRCMECLADCDCESGQYCHKDAGVCNTVNGVYTCDLGSAQKLGLCRKKDINKEILGKACRSGAGATLAQSGAFAVAANPNTAQLLVSEGPNYNGDDTSATADKFCGEVLFYNASSNVANVRGGEARSILWEGYCFNGECHECAPNTVDTCQGRRSCINGQQMETINVDGTIRTFTSNTVAGTLLAGVMMIILVQALIVCRICQARKYHRAGEAKEAVEDDAESIKA